MTSPLYRGLVDRLASDIREGILPPGGQLPTMRALAEQMGVTVGTIYRAYALAEKRGLISRQTGRGTFVRGGAGLSRGAGRGAAGGDRDAVVAGVVDLSRNEPGALDVAATLSRSLIALGRDGGLERMLAYGDSQGMPRHREIFASWIKKRGYEADSEYMIITSGAQQALTVSLGALGQSRGGLMVEEFTYPGIKNLARMFGLELIPIAMDGKGLIPQAFDAACRERDGKILYCMPSAHNPTTASLTLSRRVEIADIAARHGVVVIEDDVNPQRPDPPDGERTRPTIAQLYPANTIYISSLSKTVAPGLRVGALCAPKTLYPSLLAASQSTSWMAPPLMTELACRWIEEGTVDQLAAERDAATQRLHGVAERCLAGLEVQRDRHNTHLWLKLDPAWTGSDFAAKAASQGILVTPGEAFAIEARQVAPAARVCLSEPDESRLSRALGQLAHFAKEGPGPVAFQM
ncbi:MAG: PLP-dependent aminotransferase family protein [Pseudomonadota bacterium]